MTKPERPDDAPSTPEAPDETPPAPESPSEAEALRAAQEALLARRKALTASREAEEEAQLDDAQKRLDDLRRRTGVRGTVQEKPWLRVLTSLSAHADKPEVVRARAAEAARQEALARRTLLGHARRAEIPEHPKVWDLALSDAPLETVALRAFREVFEVAMRLARPGPFARVVAGTPGTGKTVGMVWAMLHPRPGRPLTEQMRAAPPCLFVPATRVAATPQNGFSENGELWKRWLTVPVLAVDDAGTEPEESTALITLFEQRWSLRTITLVTTNLNEGQWWRRYTSSRLADRWRNEQKNDGFPWHVVVQGRSMRGGAP